MKRYPRTMFFVGLLIIWFIILVMSLQFGWFKYLSHDPDQGMMILLLLSFVSLCTILFSTFLLALNWIAHYKSVAEEEVKRDERRKAAEISTREIIQKVDERLKLVERDIRKQQICQLKDSLKLKKEKPKLYRVK